MEVTSEIKLDPEIEALLETLPILSVPDVSAQTLDSIRSGSIPMELSDVVQREDIIIREDPKLSVRVHSLKETSQKDRPCVYSIHGGGYVAGSVDLDDAFFDELCQQTGCVGISVDYRLAPEFPYPVPIEDCYAGLAWVFKNAEAYGIDPDRVGIHGISGGGGLAAALALMVRDRGEYQLAYQLLDCPMLDDRQVTPSSRAKNLVGWSTASNSFGWTSYLGDIYGSDKIPYLAAPSRAEDLSALPPAYVCVGGADGFRDEGIEYAMKLEACGTPCELHVYAGAPHAVLLFPSTDVGRRYLGDKNQWLRLKIETSRGSSWTV